MRRWIVYGIVGILAMACAKDKAFEPIPLDCSQYELSYSQDVAPIIEAKCATGLGPGTGCHDLWILTYDGLMGRVNTGAVQRVIYEARTMPPVPNSFGIPDLTEDERNQIMCWIYSGSPNN